MKFSEEIQKLHQNEMSNFMNRRSAEVGQEASPHKRVPPTFGEFPRGDSRHRRWRTQLTYQVTNSNCNFYCIVYLVSECIVIFQVWSSCSPALAWLLATTIINWGVKDASEEPPSPLWQFTMLQLSTHYS